MNTIRFMVALAILQILCIGSANAQTNLLDGKKWSKTSLKDNSSSFTFQLGGVQGAAILNGVMYQFRGANDANNKIPTYDMYDISAGTWTSGGSLSALENSHMGSANFGTKVFKTTDGYTYDCTIPFVYITNDNTIQIYDIEHNVLVATWTLPKLDDDAIAAFDFANGKLWSIGYVSGSRKAPYLVREIDNLDFTAVPNDKTFTDSEITSYTVGHSTESSNDLQNGTIQDAQYVNGNIYFCTGGGSDYHRTEYCRIHVYDTSSKTLIDTKMCVESGESEGFVYDTNTQSFLMTTGTYIWKLSAGTGYDTQYNFEPATLVNGYYEIDTASKLLWFKQQVYGGCQDIKAKLTADINMSGITDPYSYYVYDINMPGNRVYDATNAFTGEFDGQNHTISNYSITSTPYNNDGLFPYCVGATIKNLTVSGTIELSTCTNASGTSGSAVSNVGLIGYMDGGTVTGVDVSGLTIDQTVAGTDGTVNKLIGGRGTNEITESDNITTTYTHDANGHVYKNGFCISEGTCDAPYQTPTQTDGVYQITNAGNLWYFAKNLSTLGYGSNAKLTDDINMEGSVHGSFPGIGGYTGSVATEFHGTFDGNGKTISNFYMSSSSRCGLFNSTMGTSDSYATIKNFTITGDMAISGTATQRGSVVGYAEEYTKMEDITSSVNITVSSGTPAQVGGIAGRAAGIMNRCRYNGTLNAGSATTFIGGIAGEEFHYKTGDCIENCLFDGTIIATTNSNLKLGGIGGGTEASYNGVIKNCLSKGTISLSGSYSGNLSGIVTGASISTITISDTYYLKDATSTYTISDAIGSGGTGTITGTPIEVTNKVDLTDNQLLYNLQQNAGQTDSKGNWIAGTSYPIPGVGDLVSEPTATYYTIEFKDYNGTVLSSSSVKAGEVITAPTDPTRTGYDFSGWDPAFVAGTTTATADATYTATYKSNQTYSNGFNTNTSCDASLKYEEPSCDDGVYQIANGGELYWLATKVNAGEYGANAVLTEDIDLEGSTRKITFPCMGVWVSGTDFSKAYQGDFDGKGHSISGFYESANSDRQALFSLVYNAKIYDFSLSGEMTLSGGTKSGSVVGYAYGGNTQIENIHSSVKITVTGGQQIGGIIGSIQNGTINKCRYDGTLTSTNAYNKIAGIAGSSVGGKINNTLFDGVLSISSASTPASLIAGGIVGCTMDADGNEINNCLVNGTITIDNSTLTKCGVIVGYISKKSFTGTTIYYSLANVTSGLTTTSPALEQNSGTDPSWSMDAAQVTEFTTDSWKAVETALNENGIVSNWGINSKEYPVPGETDATPTYTITFNTDGGSEVASITAAVGTEVAAPDAPTKDGYTFAGWVDASNNAFTFPYTMTAADITLTATWTEVPKYINGFKTSGTTTDADYYQTPESVDGVYQIANAGELWYFSKNISTLGVNANAILTADIDMEETAGDGTKHGSFPGISGYTGIFDGNGKTISNYYQKGGQGMFTTTDGATIKNFTLTGNVYISAGNAGAVVGIANNKTTIEDVTSSVYLQFTGYTNFDKIKNIHVGGIAGRANGVLNRCRFNGKIESTNASNIQYLGGIAGEAYHGYVGAGITNCLFDGEISVVSTLSTLQIGGISGGNEKEAPGIINHNFSHGTITIPSGYTGTQSGVVSGMAIGNLTTLANYYTVSSSTGTTLAAGIGSSTDRLYHAPSCIATEVTEAEDLTTGKLLEKLGSKNWVYDETLGYPKPLVGGGGTHSHSFDTDGFCVAMDIEDGGYQPVDAAGSDGYAISNAGQLYDFATKVNDGTIALTANAKLTADINMEYVNFPGIGGDKKVYAGTFDGQGHSIINYARVCTGGGSGFFNYASGTVKDFSISGNMFTKHDKSSDGYFGGIVGNLNGGIILDVHSSVNITINYGEYGIAGIAGYGKGTINRCRYDGTIATVNSELKHLSTDIAGICGYTEGLTLTNCLFDGKIISYYDGTNTATLNKQQIGGIVGRQQSGTLTLNNNLSNGTISLPNITSEDYMTLTGIVLGNSAAGTLTASTNYYTTTNCTYGSTAFTASYGTSSTLTPADGTITDVGTTEWSSILLILNNNVAEMDAGERNWTITAGAEYPIPHYSKTSCTHTYDADGYCTNCKEAQPMDGDATNGYIIANAGQLASFRDLVSSSTVGTEINAKLTANVNLAAWSDDDMIGSESKPYCGTFDGQGYTISGVHISPTTSKKHVGLFACVGLNGSGNNNGLRGNTMTVEGNVKNLSVTGSITNTKYYCNQDVDDPLDMGVIGELFDGLVQNVHSSVNLTSTNASRVQVGGIVGGVHIASSENITAKAVIDQCSYGPSCGPTKSAENLAAKTADTDGIINVNGFDDIAGILGYMQHHVTISNCLYYGHIKQTYDDTQIPSTATKGVTELYTQMGGILGYTTSSGTQGSTVDNNLVLGDFSVPTSIAGTTFETENMVYVHQDNGSANAETAHHNVNAIVGYTGVNNFVINCYASEHVSISEHTNLQLNKASGATNITVNVETDDTFDRGMVTAELNLNSKATYGKASDDDKANLTAEPWGQVLGYQMGWNGERNYDKVTPTPSELYSHPGYTATEPTYKVVKVANSTDNTKYDYTADFYFYDDYGDTTPVPTDGANNTMKVKKIVYTRQSSLIGGYMSLCLPFEFTASMKPDDAVLYEYAGVDGEKVLFNKIDAPIAAGKPFVMHVSTTKAWGQKIENEAGTPVALYTGSYDDNETVIKNLPTEVGLYGLFNSKIIGTGYWKMKGDGSCFVKTVGTEDQKEGAAGTSAPISYCYPFRCYLKLPESGSAKVFIPVFVDDETSIARIKSTTTETSSCFNIMGQRVSNNTKGIVIINGKKYLKK